jgi:predicted regulator of Ras-like GTPase activity (Roadblock/LC7/MglB family)
MQTMPILTMQAAANILSTLENFLDKSEASYALLIDRGGSILTQAGDFPESADPTIIAALAAGSFAATRELAYRVGEADCHELYQQGGHSHILINAVDDDVVLVTIFGPQSTLGLVKFYSTRAASRIAAVLHKLRAEPHVEPVFTEQDVTNAHQIFGR